MVRKSLLFPTALSTLFLTSCLFFKSDSGKDGGASKTSTVNIRNTEAKDQGAIGFCWSYSLHGLVESWALQHKGIKVDLSEEAIGFYHLAEQLKAISTIRLETLEELETHINRFELTEGSHYDSGLEYLANHGVVPESIWNVKFGWTGDTMKTGPVKRALKQAMIAYVREVGRENITLDGIISKVMVGEGRFPSAPPRSFEAAGRTWTAKEYLTSYLGFDPTQYQNVFNFSVKSDGLINGLKQAMARGLAVPIAIPVFNGLATNYEAQGRALEPENFTANSGHALLATDYVNAGGHPGAMTVAEIEKELRRPASDLSYLIVKNSYGTDGANESQDPGYAIVDKTYLDATTAYKAWSVVLPKDIANDLYSRTPREEPVSQAVSTANGNDIVGDIFEADIAEGRGKKLFAGFPDGSFRPKKLVTREQMVGFVIGMLRAVPGVKAETTKPEEPPFSDVAPTRWSAPIIAWAKTQKLVSGYPDGSFAPEKPVTRAEVVAMLFNAAQYARKTTKGTTTLPLTGEWRDAFWDVGEHWAKRAIQDLSRFCRVATAFNDRNAGDFQPNRKSYRNYAAAATNRLHNCLLKNQ